MDGDDVAQQAWTQALAAYPRLTHARNLRSWLYTPTGDPDRTFAAAIERDAATIEADYDATIDVVAVGL